MNKTIRSFVRKAISDQSGQILPWLAVVLVGMLGTAGLTIDVGRAYVAHSQLQNYANAAALAAAGEVYNTSSTTGAPAVANLYSGSSGNQNGGNNLGTVTTTVTTVCAASLMPTGESCTGAPANAVKVTQTASVPTTFMKLFGFNSLSVSSQAMASMQGMAQAWNVAIIVDGTQSMGSKDSNCGNLTRFQCALSGVQSFLEATDPCPGGLASCPTNATSSSANLRVALFAFPNILTTSGFSDTATCNGPFTSEPYTLPTTTASTYSPIKYTGTTAYTATYQMTAWDSSYYQPSSSSTSGLNSSDNLVQAIGYGYDSTKGTMTHQGCLPNVGGQSTYYGGVLYSAQAALLQAQKAYGGKNAIILLSDGEANAAYGKFPQKTSNTTAGVSVTSAGTSTYSGTATNLTSTASTWGTYPDFNDECQQAIVAAQAAAAAGTRVYAVAYGSASSGCYGDTDSRNASNLTQSSLNVNWGGISNLKPCETMENIANPEAGSSVSWQTYFYSDNQQSGSTTDKNCVNGSQAATSLQDIFLAISATFTTPRLLPNNSTYIVVPQS